MLKLSETKIINDALRIVERAQKADANAAALEIEALQLTPDANPLVKNIVSDAHALATSFSLRTPEERNSLFFQQSVRDLKERAERAGE